MELLQQWSDFDVFNLFIQKKSTSQRGLTPFKYLTLEIHSNDEE